MKVSCFSFAPAVERRDDRPVFRQARPPTSNSYLLSASVHLASTLHSSDFGSVRYGLVYATGRQVRYSEPPSRSPSIRCHDADNGFPNRDYGGFSQLLQADVGIILPYNRP
jgi:hypothetical protein